MDAGAHDTPTSAGILQSEPGPTITARLRGNLPALAARRQRETRLPRRPPGRRHDERSHDHGDGWRHRSRRKRLRPRLRISGGRARHPAAPGGWTLHGENVAS